MKFYNNLTQAIKEKKLKQRELAKMLNTTQTCISKYCNGQRDPSIETIYKLCKILEITPNDLFDFHDFDLDEIRKEKQQSKYNQSFTISGGNVDIRQE